MADDFPDLHHKLCKKAASLTAGCFYLQLKSDENDLILQATIDAYEKEMDNVVQTANDILDKHMKENPQDKEVKEIHAAYQQFKQHIEEERSLAAEQFNNYKQALEEKYEQREKDVEDLMKSHEEEVEAMFEKLKYMQELVQKTIGDDVEQHYQKEMEQKRLLESKDFEIEDLRRRYLELERMYKELEESRFLSGKRISGEWSHAEGDHDNPESKREEWENEVLKKKIVEQEKLIFALRNLVHENIIEDAEYAPSIEFGGSNTGEMSALSVQLSTLQKEAKNAKAASLKALKDRDDEIEKLRDKIKEGGSDDKVQKIIEEYEGRMKEATREHRKMIESLSAEYNDNIAEMEADFDKERMRWESKEQGMQITLESRNEYIAGLEEKLRIVEEMSTKYKTKSELEIKDKEENLSQEIQRLNNVLEDSRKIFDEKLEANLKKAEEVRLKLLEETKSEKEKSLQALREELNNERRASEVQKDAKIKDLEAQLKNLQEAPKNTELAEEYQNKINDLSQRHNTYVRDLLEKHEEKIQSMTKQYQQELENLSNALQREKESVLKMKDDAKNSEIVNLKKDYEAKMHKISKSYDQQLQEKIQEFEAKLSAKDTEIATLKAELDAIKEQLRAEKRKFDMKNSLYKDLKKKLEIQKSQSPARSMQIAPQEKSTLSESVYSFRDSMVKAKEEVSPSLNPNPNSNDEKGKDQIIKDHLAYTEKMEKLLVDLKKEHEEKINVLTNQLNEVVAAFKARPSKDEDVTYIRQLQEENFEKEEEIRKLMDGPKVYLPEVPPRRENHSFTKGFNSSTHLNTSSMMTQGDFKRKTQKSLINPQSTASILPPISISQFTIQFRSPQINSSMASTKKFFK